MLEVKKKPPRKKKRVEGSATPPRKPVPLRLEVSTFERMDTMLQGQTISRNKYIEALIEADLDYRDQIAVLSIKGKNPAA